MVAIEREALAGRKLAAGNWRQEIGGGHRAQPDPRKLEERL